MSQPSSPASALRWPSVTDRVASTADFDAAEGQGVPLVMVPGVASSEHTDQMVLDQYIVTFE